MLHSDYTSAPHAGLRLGEDRVAGSMLASRRTLRVPSQQSGPFVPQGSGQSGSSTMSFQIQANPDELLDCSTLRLRFDYIGIFNKTAAGTYRGKNDTYYAPGYGKDHTTWIGSPNPPFWMWMDDGAASLLRSARVRLNGTLLEDISYFNVLDHYLVYFSASRDWLYSNGLSAGYYIDYMLDHPSDSKTGAGFNNHFFSDGLKTGLSDIPFCVKQCANGATFTLPLVGLGIGRSKRYWPLIGMTLSLEFDLETWDRCHAVSSQATEYTVNNNLPIQVPGNPSISVGSTGSGSPPYNSSIYGNDGSPAPGMLASLLPLTVYQPAGYATPIFTSFQSGGYQISNAIILCDFVKADTELTTQIFKLLKSKSVGFSIPYDSFECIRFDASQAGFTPGSLLEARGSVAVQDMISITAIFRDQATIADSSRPNKTNTFLFPYLDWSQWIVGNQFYPTFPLGQTAYSGANTGSNTTTLYASLPAYGTPATMLTYAPVDTTQLMTSGASDWLQTTYQSLGIVSTNDMTSGCGIITPYTFMGYSPVVTTELTVPYTDTGYNYAPGTTWTRQASPGQDYSRNTPLLSARFPRFAIGQSLEVAPNSHSGVNTTASTTDFSLRLQVSNATTLSGILGSSVEGPQTILEVLFFCRYNAAIVFADGAISVRR